MTEEEKFKIYLRILNEENSIDKKEEAMLGLLGLYYKQQTEIEELKDKNASLQKEIKLMKSININENYISKDKILDILGYEEDDEQRKNMTIEKTLSLLETIISEINRLEDIEDTKVQLEIFNIENKRDKYWKDKIRDKQKELEVMLRTYIENSKNDIYYNSEYVNSIEMSIKILKEILEE